MNTDQKSPLLAKMKKVYQRLRNGGWDDVFKAHGLDLDANDLKAELLRPLPSINRGLRGFEDFALEGRRGIEPGQPALSLLYHALASPNVTQRPDGELLTCFPTPAQLEAVENLVYGLVPPSIQELRVRTNDAPMALVVFASEYRPAFGTVHQKHADVCFARAGVARVGTAAHHYLPAARGYFPVHTDNTAAIRVLPCRYSTYIAARLRGQPDGFGPMQFQTNPKSDAERDFWVPLHKVFSGAECLRGLSLTVALKASHINEKLRRVHRGFARLGLDTGWHDDADLNKSPFVFRDGIAAFSTDPDDGEGLLVPVVHPALVAQAKYQGEILTYRAPKNRPLFLSSATIAPKATRARSAPEYVHVRHRMEAEDRITDLNTLPDMLDVIKKGDYNAVHYLDYTGEGFIEAECPELALELPRMHGAYSMVAAVDFFPLVKQHELIQWWKQSAPPELEGNIWPSNPGRPLALSDTRYAANPTMTSDKLTVDSNLSQHNKPRSVFNLSDETVSAIVGLFNSGHGQPTQVDDRIVERATWLPDGASGVFAPGWDTSIDRTEEAVNADASISPGVTYFNNYGLGSPFPEDAMLCAALSAYWPAAAPDITRTFAPEIYATATPLTDDQIGLTDQAPWDGIKGPVIPDLERKEVEYRQVVYADYVQAALKASFNISTVARTTTREYIARTLVMARAYSALGAVTREQKRAWSLLSFMPVTSGDKELDVAEQQAKKKLSPTVTYRFKMFRHRLVPPDRKPADHRNKLVGFDKIVTLYADPQSVLLQDDNDLWFARHY